MIMTRRFSRLLFSALAFTGLIGLKANLLASTEEIAANSRIVRLQNILGIAGADADLLGPLAATIRQFGSPNQDLAVQDLVDALNHGASATSLSGPFLAHIRGNDLFFDDKSWGCGQWSDVFRIAKYLFDHAKLEFAENPKKAARMARAAILLLAHQDFLASTYLRTICGDVDFDRVANLDTKTSGELTRFAKEEMNKTEAFRANRADIKMWKAVDRITSSYPERVNQADLDVAIAAFKTCFNQVSDHPEDQHDITMALSEVVALLRVRGTQEQRVHFRALILDRKTLVATATLQRWLQEAADYDGPPPENLHVRIMTTQPKIMPR